MTGFWASLIMANLHCSVWDRNKNAKFHYCVWMGSAAFFLFKDYGLI